MDTPSLNEAGVQNRVHIPNTVPPQEVNDLLLDDAPEPLGSYPFGESAEHGPGIAPLVFPYEAEPPDSGVGLQDPREFPEAPDGLHPHDDEGPEDDHRVPRRPSWARYVVRVG